MIQKFANVKIFSYLCAFNYARVYSIRNTRTQNPEYVKRKIMKI